MISLYDISVPVVLRALEQLSAELKKGEKWCGENKVEKTVITEGKISDMLPLTFQVQSACNSAKGILFRVGGEENVREEDKEKTFEELYARIERTVEQLRAAKREKFIDENQEVKVMWAGKEEVKFNSLVYLQNFMLPNFFFHRTAAYLIMRAAGVEVGKKDFVGFESITASAATS